jgi:hypothetical protein
MRGRLRGGIEIFDNIDQLVPFVSRAPTERPSWVRDTDVIKLIVVSALTFMFAVSVIYVVIASPDNKSL